MLDKINQPVSRSRRAFIKAEFKQPDNPGAIKSVRPPWTVSEWAFVDGCTRCGLCVTACPQDIIVNGDAGYPEVDFSVAECTFCGRCHDSCPEPVFDPSQESAFPDHYTLSIRENCLAARGIFCQSCRDECPHAAISFAQQPGRVPQPEINHEACSLCGACVSKCPAKSISLVASRGICRS